ncbi:MAG: aminomethyl-transferring glycine dehydrogenase [Phycisphaerales bacterium]|nr:aminomethyl-transferring glycine dehydrogenase [Phycisphaerales bacterium]
MTMTSSGSAASLAGKGNVAGGSGSVLNASDTFAPRHIGPSPAVIDEMLAAVGYPTLDALGDAIVPAGIRRGGMNLPAALTESEAIARLKGYAEQNTVARSMIGMGYHDTIVPPVILRNILENPGWYTQYTPYQAEIAQGRLEALLNFQTMVADLTGLPLAGASLLDEATAAAEAMAMCYAICGGHEASPQRKTFVVASDCHPQTIAVVQTRAETLGMNVKVVDAAAIGAIGADVCGVLVQYPSTFGTLRDFEKACKDVHAAGGGGAQFVVATDLLALTLIKPPGEFGGGGADIAIGSSQRLGVPMGFGGPHAAFIATRPEHARRMPGRIIGVSRDAQGNTALRMAIQTREQHIKREKATSNICTAQALLAICAGMYAVYHGPEGLRRIAQRTHAFAESLRAGLKTLGHTVTGESLFDTVHVKPVGRTAQQVIAAAHAKGVLLRDCGDGFVTASCDETTSRADIQNVLTAFGGTGKEDIDAFITGMSLDCGGAFARQSGYLTHPVFNTHHSESEMLRYIFKLMGRDLSLAQSMIALGSCTMKLNATSEMIPVTWEAFGRLHPFCPPSHAKGYHSLFKDLEAWLAECTGFDAVSLQPNAGSQGEYAGLLVIRAYHRSRGDTHRDICLIPTSAHGTNPASAVIAGMKVVPVACDASGNVDLADLEKKATTHSQNLAALMVTYPSTHGVFEEGIKEITAIIHRHGGQVYMDGANMNAQVGLTSPGNIGADVCHLNLHKTFCIPHGGGGPGMGPICVRKHLAPFLSGHPIVSPFIDQSDINTAASAGSKATGPVSAAPWGSPSILVISWMYIAMMGPDGLKKATQVAMLNANYMAKRIESEGRLPILYRGKSTAGKTGLCAHEFILDTRSAVAKAGCTIDDIAKRLMDYGFHAPTMSFPVPGTLMIEPTESEDKAELDRFCEAMIGIANEMEEVATGKADKASNVLKHAPHTQMVVCADEWTRPYPRSKAAYPALWLKDSKFWPPVSRIDNPFGDRNLICTCPPMTTDA